MDRLITATETMKKDADTAASDLLMVAEKDRFAAMCPNPNSLQRCTAGVMLDRYNHVAVPSASDSLQHATRDIDGR